MRPYKKRHQAWWMTMDEKPKGKDRRLVEKMTRSDLKKDTNKQLNDYNDMRQILGLDE